MADKKKHILFISSWYPNRNDPTHGIFNKYFAQAAGLYNTVSVINVSSEKHLPTEFELIEQTENEIVTVNVYYRKVLSAVPIVSQVLKRKKVLTAFKMGYEKINRERGKPDLIHLNVVMPMGVGVLFLSKKYNIPYVVNENWSGYTTEDGNYKGFTAKFFTQKIIQQAKFILPTSTYLRDAMLSHGLNGKYEVVPNVVNTSVFKPSQVVAQGTTLIHISSLNDREKNVSGLLRAFKSAADKQPQLFLKIVGEGVDKEKYKRLVKELQLQDKVFFHGRLVANDLVKQINHSDALIMFSNYETFCLVIIEAFACGKPVITSAAGAIKTYMKPELGKMVAVGDEKALANAILEFTESKKEFNAEQIRNYAVKNYSYEEVGKQLDRIYHEALNK